MKCGFTGPPAALTLAVAGAPFTLIIQIDAWNIRGRDFWGDTQAMADRKEEWNRWHWVYSATCFHLEQRCRKGKHKDKLRAIITHRSYVATRGGIDALMPQLYYEARARGLATAQRVLVIADGAVWIWNLVVDRFGQAIVWISSTPTPTSGRGQRTSWPGLTPGPPKPASLLELLDCGSLESFDNLGLMDAQLNERRAADAKLVEDCLNHDPAALEELRQKHLVPLRSILISRGAYPAEADDLIDGVWADCAIGRADRGPLLERFNGKCSLHNWLATIATHLLYDQLRRRKFRAELPQLEKEDRVEEVLERLGALLENPAESDLTRVILISLQAAFAACPAEELLMIRLLYFHGLSQRDLCRMWGWSEPKVSRRLKSAMEDIKKATLRHLALADPDLKLVWEDFEELCQTQQLAFL